LVLGKENFTKGLKENMVDKKPTKNKNSTCQYCHKETIPNYGNHLWCWSFTENIKSDSQEYKLARQRIEQSWKDWIKTSNFLSFDEDAKMWLKECEGCYCRIFVNKGYDFCFDCLGAKGCGHSNYNPDFGNCCACFEPKSKLKTKKERKKLNFTQKQRFYWEEVKLKAEDIIEEIKDEENPDFFIKHSVISDITKENKRK